MATSNTFQKSFTRMLVGAALISLTLTLVYQAQNTWAVFELIQAGVSAGMTWGTTVIGKVYAGSVALNGLTVVLLVGSTHARFWARVEWSGKQFAVPEKPSLAKASKAATWAGVMGYLFLICSLCEYAEVRSGLDTILGLVALAVLLNILSHKSRMAQIVTRHGGWPSTNSYENMVRGVGSVLAALAVAVFINTRSPHLTWGLPLLGIGYCVLAYVLLKRFRLPDIRTGGGPAEFCYEVD